MVRILGIETSCDETGIGIVEDGERILANAVASSLEQHAPYGGVIPEIAARAHVESLDAVLAEALTQARCSLDQIDAVAVTYGPGLPGALLIGLAFAKGLALRLNKPLVPVDHLAAHLHAAYLAAGRPQQACLGVVLSGGHTLLCIRRGIAFELLGETRDDAMGESFDKVAKLMGLGYPGGPVIDRLAQQGNPQAIGFVRAQTKHRFDFSFSGLKTAVLQYLKGHTQPQQAQEVSAPAAALLPDLAASFQECAVDMVVHRITRAVEETGLRTVLLGGGVTLNTRLRARLHQVAHERGFGVVFPPAVLCSDNGAMIAAAAFDLYERGVFAPLALMPEPDLCLTPFNQTVEA